MTVHIDELHFRRLEHMYSTAPINQLVESRLTVERGRAEVRMLVDARLFHAAGSLHGSIYFKGLDDAAFFAASSVVCDNFVLTAHFEVDLLAPVSGNELRAIGKLTKHDGRKLRAQAELMDADDLVVARGHGLFIAGSTALESIETYRNAPP